MKVKLPTVPNENYGNPLHIGDGTKEVEQTNEVNILLREGAIEPTEKVKTKGAKTPIILNIKGIGFKTLHDLRVTYKTEENLIEFLRKDEVGQRDDVVLKLKKHYKLVI